MPDTSVIIPVYGNEAAVRRCIDSVIAGRIDDDYDVIVVDDASPEEGLAQRLGDYCQSLPDTRFLAHDENRGFAAAVTTGVDACAGDVVILNSDTVVPEAWLARLQICAASSPRTGTVTPFTNSGTICTYPFFCEDAGLPARLDLATLDGLFAAANRGESVEIPTGVGFCMYISRECWNAVDGFDVEAFGSGYGEETDFCMRASAAGWSHRLCADLFVYHDGGVSFGDQRQGLMDRADRLMAERHPSYGERVERFIQEDPVAPLRARVDEARKIIDGQPEVLAAEASKRQALTERRLFESQSVAADRLSELGELQDQLADYQRLLDESRDAYTAVEAEAERRARAYEDLENDYSALTADYKQLEAQLEEHDRQLAETTSALAKLQAEYADLYRDRDETALARDQVQHLADEYRQSIETLEQALAALEALATERQAQIETLEAMWGVRLQRKIERLKGS